MLLRCRESGAERLSSLNLYTLAMQQQIPLKPSIHDKYVFNIASSFVIIMPFRIVFYICFWQLGFITEKKENFVPSCIRRWSHIIKFNDNSNDQDTISVYLFWLTRDSVSFRLIQLNWISQTLEEQAKFHLIMMDDILHFIP